MASADIGAAVRRHTDWGLRHMDLKDSLFGGGVLELTNDQAISIRDLVTANGLDIYCLSTMIGDADIEVGEQQFRAQFEPELRRAREIGQIFRPRFVRLLAAHTSRRAEIDDSPGYIADRHPWLLEFYRDAIDDLSAAGLGVTIENEVGQCIWADEREIVGFFELLDRPDRAVFTWDIANLWQMGSFPSMSGYVALRPYIGYVHLKGGRAGRGSRHIKWASSLADTSWPLEQLVRQVVEDDVSPIICLNPSHGAIGSRYDAEGIVERDLATVRAIFDEFRS